MNTSFGETGQTHSKDSYSISVVLKEVPQSRPWSQAGITSDFVAEIVARQSAKAGLDYTETRHTIVYLVNELLENAIKFSCPGDVEIRCSLEDDSFELAVVNQIDPEMVPNFQALIEELTSRDPGELLIERIEANAADEESSASGLGILTLMNDYGVRMGWHFSNAVAGSGVVLRTQACLTFN
jgi:hypothetical protein